MTFNCRILVDPKESDQPNWSNRSSWITGGESIYALLAKFGELNALTSRELCDLFVVKRKHCNGLQAFLTVDLRYSDHIRKGQLVNLIGIDGEGLNAAFLGEKFPNSVKLSSRSLVWCPKCAQMGFHSAVFQLNYCQVCPVHLTPLSKVCPKCHQPLPYSLGPSSPSLFTCAKCRLDLAQGLRTHKPILCLNKRAVATMRDHVHLVHFADSLPALFNACKSQLGRPNVNIEMAKADVIRRSSAYRQFVLDVLSSLAASPAVPELAPMKPVGIFREQPGQQSLPSRADAEESYLRAFELYRVVKRHIFRSVCRGHASCIHAAQKTLWWDLEGERISAFCPTATAFLRWRMQWEGRRIPGMLDMPRERSPAFGILGWLSAEAPVGSTRWARSLDSWMHSQLLACALIDSFAEWQRAVGKAKATFVWQKSVASTFGKRHWACCGRGTRDEPALLFLEPTWREVTEAPHGSGAHVRRTRKILNAVRR